MAKIILCLANEISDDPHIDAIEKHVKALDSEARVVRLDPVSDSNFIEVNIANTSKKTPPSCFVIVDGERISAESITSVWYGWHPVGQRADTLQEYIAKDFATSEWGRVISSLQSYLSDARWVNHLDALSLANRKPYQLLLAQQVGLTVPKTVITNNPAAVEKLFDQANNERVIFKTMGRLYIPPDKQVFTVEVPRGLPSRFSDSITKCPAIFQELVERKADLRITIVGREVFAVRIDSQTLEEDNGRLDWRRYQERNELYSEAQIPESFKNRLLEFHEKAGLVFAAYDFLERDDGIIFLECNPCRAAWLWLEQCLDLKITEHIARYLLGIE